MDSMSRCRKIRKESGTKVCTGDFAPPEPKKLGPNSGKRILDARILDPNSWVEVFNSVFFQQKRPLKNSPSRNSPPKIHLAKFNPEIGSKIHIAPLQGHLAKKEFSSSSEICWKPSQQRTKNSGQPQPSRDQGFS